jgi:hypothetical protein
MDIKSKEALMRKLETGIGTFNVKQDKCCVFCKNCNSFLYDSHGPYLIHCKLYEEHEDEDNIYGEHAEKHNRFGECDGFEDEYEEV